MPDAIASKSDDAIGSPDVIYVPDAPGLNPTAVTLPLKLESRLRARTLGALALAIFLWLCLALAVGREFGGISPIDFKPNNWYMMSLCIAGLGLCHFWFASAFAALINRLVHVGPNLTLHAAGLDYSYSNRSIVALKWTEVTRARFVDSVNPDGHPGFKDALSLRCAGPDYNSGLVAPPLRFPIWLRSRPPNELLLPMSNLSLHPEQIRHVIEALLRRHGKSIEEHSSPL